MTVADDRKATADAVYENFNFSYNVVDASGWDDDGSDELTKPVFLEDDENPDGASLRGTFVVRFENEQSSVPVEAYAIVRGAVVGTVAGDIRDYAVATSPSP